MRWLGRRQLPYEGGFSGRSNKLVDGCYSFWQGGATSIASSCSDYLAGKEDGESDLNDDPWLARYQAHRQEGATSPSDHNTTDLPFPLLYDVFLLERYILLCAQEVTGGLRDKPSKPRDFYHTCYCLSGLSVAQWYGELPVLAGGNATAKERKANVVEKTNVLLNVVESKYTNWMDNFGGDIDME